MFVNYDKDSLLGLCLLRGYTLEEIRPCIVSDEDGVIILDTTHAAFPKTPKPGDKPEFIPTLNSQKRKLTTNGVGTKLKKLLTYIGIHTTPDCACNTRADYMNQQGIEWCEQHIETIVGWLRDEAQRRRLPFIDAAGRLLVKRAIKLARADS